MPYQALYRKYRSQTFDDVVGQEAITTTLKNAISQNKISHAYLFNGPRGTGKTSCAKIFAKAINCPHQHNGEPCNKCDICRDITEGKLNDVIEIDAASNNGVEEIREIRDKAKYAPTVAKYKVYIIDEVHMLSKGAFNALLKTLEEPPHNVIFILATTEPHKIPATIISRTQRFDFKRIADTKIVAHLAHILDDLNIKYEESALKVVAQIAEGGMRDALSILDQIIAFSSDEEVTLAATLSITGSLTTEMMFNYLVACIQQDVPNALNVLNEILASGKEPTRIVDNLISYLRDFLLYIEANIMPANDSILAEFSQLKQNLSGEFVNQMINLLFTMQEEMKNSQNQVIYLEVMTIKLTKLEMTASTNTGNVPDLANQEVIMQLQQKVQQLEQQIQMLTQNTSQAGQVNAKPQVEVPQFKINYEQVEQILLAAQREYLEEIKEAWSEILNILNDYQRALLQPTHTKPVAASQNGLVLSAQVDVFARRIVNDQELLQNLRQAIQRILQRDVQIEFVLDREWSKIRSDFLSRRKEQMTAANHLEQSQQKQNVDKDEEQFMQAVNAAKETYQNNIEILDD